MKQHLTALPFEGGWGDVTPIISRIMGICIEKHPPSPLQRGNCTVQTKILGKNFNILPLVKQNLTALPLEGGRGREQKNYFYLSIYLETVEIIRIDFVKEVCVPCTENI